MSDGPSGKSLFKRARRDPLRGHPIEDPFDVAQAVTQGTYAPTNLHQLNLDAQRLRAMRHEGITSLYQLQRNIKILPHQVKASIRVLNQLQGRAILADEVGLGKTIEAGIVMKELISRGKVRSILILTPAALASQWQQELWEKFGERFVRHDDPMFRGFARHDKVVSSIDTAKSAQHYPDIIAREWDLVIIDEAHYLKNKKTQRYALADDISARYALMLTATPIQNNLMELYNLINLIKPGLLGTLQNFEEEYIGDAQGRVLLHAQRLQRLLEQVLIRNRRSETGIKFPDRNVETNRVQASEEEMQLHRAVSDFIRKYRTSFESHLALLILEREVASSAPALSATLGNMMAKVDDQDALKAMEELQHMANKQKKNAKMELIREVATGTDEKMIIFTQFRATQDQLTDWLRAEGLSVLKYHGGLSAMRRKNVLKEFRESGQVLVATDSGSEGLNLQFCHVLVNYDLPWNPMRVEQRIGRVHRIGQEQDKVIILNLAVADTIEDYVLQVLYEKIKLFEVAIGEMDLILSDINEAGGLEKRVIDAILSSERDEDIADALGKVERDLKRSKAQADDIKQLDASVFQQFDLSTANDDVDIEDKMDLLQEVQRFVGAFVRAVDADMTEEEQVTKVTMPRNYWKRIGGTHKFTTDPETFEELDGEVEYLSLGSDFVRKAIELLQHDGHTGCVRTAEVDEPATLLYYRYFIETIRSEVEAFVSVTLDDAGNVLDIDEDLRPIPDAEPCLAREEDRLAGEWEKLAENARFEVADVVVPVLNQKRDEALEELRRVEKRLEEYFERQKEEIRHNEMKIRRKMGDIRNRLYFTEDGIRERKLEQDYEKLEKQLHESTFKNNRKIEELDSDLQERLAKEREKNEPRLQIELIGATRLLPPADVVAPVAAGEAVKAEA